MPASHPALSHTNAASQIAVAVKLPPQAASANSLDAAMALARRLADDRIPATWVASNPATGPVLQQILPIVTGSDVGLEAFAPARQAGSAMEHALWSDAAAAASQLRAAGLHATTLYATSLRALAGRELALARLGFRAVLTPSSETADQCVPRRLTQDLWQFGVAMEFPLMRFWGVATNGHIGRLVRRAKNGVVVLCIELERIVGAESKGLRRIERIIDVVAWAKSTGAAQIATLGEIAREQSSRLAPHPQKSILRAA